MTSSTEFKILPLGSSYREDIKAHYLRLPKKDQYNRFMFSMDDKSLSEWVDKIDFARTRIFGIYVTSKDEKPILAAVSLLTFDTNKTKHAEIALSVDALYRRSKYGWALMDRVIDEARAHGASCLKMNCLENNVSMINFAQKKGFKLKDPDLGCIFGKLKL